MQRRSQECDCSRYCFELQCVPALAPELNFPANSYFYHRSQQAGLFWSGSLNRPSLMPILICQCCRLTLSLALELVPYTVMQPFQFSFHRANFQTSAELAHLSSKERPECDPVLSLSERLSSYHIHILQRKKKHLSASEDAEEGSSYDFSIYQFL